MSNPFPPPDYPTLYRCVGIVEGQYFPSLSAFNQGILLTSDGNSGAATLASKNEKWLQANPELLTCASIWVVWPRIQEQLSKLELHIAGRRQEPTSELEKESLMKSVDYFSIQGVVIWQNDGKLGVRIRRNLKPMPGQEQEFEWQPFVMELSGFLGEQATGQFWELDVQRTGEQLVIKDGRLVMEFPKRAEKSSAKDNNRLALKQSD